MSAMFPRWNLGLCWDIVYFHFLYFCALFQRETLSVAFVEGFLPPGHYPKAVPLHCTLKVFNWLPALCLHTGWVRLSGSAPLPGSERFSSSPLMWPIAIVGGP